MTDPSFDTTAPLASDALREARDAGVPLGFDPMQQGWVRLTGRTSADLTSPPAVASEAPLAFRPWAEADLTVFRTLLDDAEVWRWLPEPYPAPLSEDLARDLIAVAQIEMHHEVRAVLWHGRPAGQVRLQWNPDRNPESPASRAEISYWLGRAHWGKGIGRAMLARAVPAAYERHPHLSTLWARVHPDNKASARILQGVGFQEDPVVRPDGWLTFHHLRAQSGGS
jgi:RimJ/RimL family protein N-acetyltransferase